MAQHSIEAFKLRKNLIFRVGANCLKMCCTNVSLIINVTVGMDKSLARLIIVRRLDVDKDRVLRFGTLDTPLSLCVLL